MNKADLKPCPFCGAEAEFSLESDHYGEFYTLGCKNKDCPANWIYYTESPEELPIAEAFKRWNSRFPEKL